MSVEALESRLALASADLSVQIAVTPLNSGGKVTFTATVENLGPDPASAAMVSNTFTIPAGAQIVSATASQGTATVSGNGVTGSLGTIPASTNVTVTIAISTTVGGSFSDTAVVSSSTPDPVSSNNTTTLTAPITYGPASIALTSSTTSATLHQPVTLTAKLTPTAGFPIASGNVTFLDGTTSLGSAALNGTGVASIVVPSLGLGLHSITASYAGDVRYPAMTSAVAPVYSGDLVKEDFTGDGKDDLTYYGVVPGTNHLYGFVTLTAATGYNPANAIIFDNQGHGFGNPSSIPVPADYFGEGKAAYAIWSPDGHGYMILQAISSVNPAEYLSIDFGLTTDVPVLGDVDGDGRVDFGVYGYDPNLGYRYDMLLSTKNFSTFHPLIFNNYGYGYGVPGASPVLADFDGSGHAGFGVYIPNPVNNTGTFTYTNVTIPNTNDPIVNPPASAFFARTFGFATDTPMAVDYDADGKADLALYGLDPRTGRYRYDVLTSSTNFNVTKDVYFDNAGLGYGYSASIPIMANYDGIGFSEFGVFQPDGVGGASFIFQAYSVGHGVAYDVANPTDLPVTAPAYLLARKVRGQ